LRYFDPMRRRAGMPEDVAALISELGDTRTVVTLVNTNETAARTVLIQAGGYGEHQFESVEWNGKTQKLDSSHVMVNLTAGAGAKLVLTMRRYVNQPTVTFPWNQK
jgi:hypothetical protein